MMGTREKLRGGNEYDTLTKKGRRVFSGVFRHAGRAAAVKRQFWKRVRKDAQRRALLAACR